MQDNPYKKAAETLANQLTQNLNAILKVAGPVRPDGSSSPLRTTEIQRRSQMARSTVKALKSPGPDAVPNPDLKTLSSLAKAADLPAYCLLMGQSDWTALIHAINGIRDPHIAAEEMVPMDGRAPSGLLESILSRCGIHPDRPPYGGFGNKDEIAQMAARNEWRQRNCSVFNALIDTVDCDRSSKVLLAAFAASYVNAITPTNPVEPSGN